MIAFQAWVALLSPMFDCIHISWCIHRLQCHVVMSSFFFSAACACVQLYIISSKYLYMIYSIYLSMYLSTDPPIYPCIHTYGCTPSCSVLWLLFMDLRSPEMDPVWHRRLCWPPWSFHCAGPQLCTSWTGATGDGGWRTQAERAMVSRSIRHVGNQTINQSMEYGSY